MIGAQALELVLGSRAPGDKTNLTMYVRELARAGLAVVLVTPGGKAPLDMRTAPMRKQDDEAVQAAAKDDNDPMWAKRRQLAGEHLATTDTKRLDKFMRAAAKVYGEDQVNLGVEVGRSNIVIVDADTAVEVAGFVQAMAEHGIEIVTPTVSTPGKIVNGEWVHKDGGHWWFTLPEGVAMPAGGTGSYKAPSGYVVYWGDRQVLIPPSVRAEGAYTWNGGVTALPEWIYNDVRDRTAARKERARDRINSLGESPIDRWAAGTAWPSLLEPAGWVSTGRPSNCECIEWTAPGPHDNPKSATAHDLGCTDERYDGETGALHVWTDNPPENIARYVREQGTKTMSKLQFVAWEWHNGDIDAACRAQDIPHSNPTDDAPAADFEMYSNIDDAFERMTASLTEPELDMPVAGDVPGDYDPMVAWFEAHAGPFDKFRDLPPVQYLVDEFLDTGSMSTLVGAPGVGKSFVALDMAAAIATGTPWQGHKVVQGRVGYVVGEGVTGFAERVKAWERAHATDLGQVVYLIDEPVQVSDREKWRYLGMWAKHLELDFMVLDTLNRITVGIEENSAKEMSVVVNTFDQFRVYAQAHVMVVHHTTRGTEHGRGSTALEGAVDTVLYVEPINGGKGVQITTTKQKNHAPADALELDITSEPEPFTSAYLTRNGVVVTSTDPMTFGDVPADITPREQMLAVARAVVASADVGMTESKVIRHVHDDDLHRKPLSPNAKQIIVNQALTRAMDEGYIETRRGSSAKWFEGPESLPE